MLYISRIGAITDHFSSRYMARKTALWRACGPAVRIVFNYGPFTPSDGLAPAHRRQKRVEAAVQRERSVPRRLGGGRELHVSRSSNDGSQLAGRGPAPYPADLQSSPADAAAAGGQRERRSIGR